MMTTTPCPVRVPRLGLSSMACAALLLVALLAGCGQPEAPPSEETGAGSPEKAPIPGRPPAVADLEGVWMAALEHNDQTGHFALQFGRGDDGALGAAISVPAIDVWDQPLGQVSIEGTAVRIGPLSLTYDSGGPRLSGIMPEALIPVYSIPVVLEPAPNLARPAPSVESLPEPAAVWTVDAGGAVWAGIEYSEGTVFAGSDGGTVVALDAASGRNLWRHQTDGPIRARPAAAAGSLLVHSDDGHVTRLDQRTGSVAWKTRIGPPVQRVAAGGQGFRYDAYSSAPVVSGDVVFVAHPGGALVALRLSDGTLLWSLDTGDTVTTTPAVHDGRVFAGSFDGRVLALDAADGSIAWERQTGAPVTTSPTVHEGQVIIGSRSYDLMSLDGASGIPAWTHYMWFSWIESAPSILGGTLYIGSSDSQTLSALDAGTGRLEWTFDTNGSAWGQPAVSDEAVFIGSVGVSGYIVAHQGGFSAVDRKTGQGLWKVTSPQPAGARFWGFASSPAAGDGMVFAGGLDGKIYAFPAR